MNKNCIDYQSDLDNFIAKHITPNMYNIQKVTYEEDSKHVLHAHILGVGWDSWQPKKIRYWSVDIQKTENTDRWLSYITKYAKNDDEQQIILLRHASHHLNLFDQ